MGRGREGAGIGCTAAGPGPFAFEAGQFQYGQPWGWQMAHGPKAGAQRHGFSRRWKTGTKGLNRLPPEGPAP